MGEIRKPVPKNQREISISQQEPLLDNPNNAVVPLPVFANQNDPATAKNYRAEQISVKGDTTKDYTVGIGDLDETIVYYFNNIIKPQVYQNGTTIPVPVIYGNPERWKAVQKDGITEIRMIRLWHLSSCLKEHRWISHTLLEIS
jgi:hypothetical protein